MGKVVATGLGVVMLLGLVACSEAGCPTATFDGSLASGQMIRATSCAEVFSLDGTDYSILCEPVHPDRIAEVLTDSVTENPRFDATYRSIRSIKGEDPTTAVVVSVERYNTDIYRDADEGDHACSGDQLAVDLSQLPMPKSSIAS